MKVGYVGRLNLPDDYNSIVRVAQGLSIQAKNQNLNFLICIGISSNYQTTLKFVEETGKLLTNRKIGFRFLPGNTDFYYPTESSVNKEQKFREILKEYQRSHYYLPNNTIFTASTRILGYESWYDYTLYRGKPKNLCDITKKSWLFFKNMDVKYITDKNDYLSGNKNTFDYQYFKQTYSAMISRLETAQRRWGDPLKHNVCVMWFLPSKNFLGNSVFDKYFGTFKGSERYLEVMSAYGITDCILGTECRKHYPERLNNISFLNVSNTIHEVEY